MPLLPVPQPFSLELTTARFRAFGLDRATAWEDGALYRAVGKREVRIAAAAGGVVVEPLDAETEAVVRKLLGFDFDLVAFSAWAAEDETLAPLVVRFAGFRPSLAPDPFEALVTSITAQQVSLYAAVAIRNRLVERFGEPFGRVWAFPLRERLVAASEDELFSVGFSRRKAEYVIALARSDLDLAALALLPDEEVKARLTALRGIGEWTADWSKYAIPHRFCRSLEGVNPREFQRLRYPMGVVRSGQMSTDAERETQRQQMNAALNDWVGNNRDAAIAQVEPLATEGSLPALVMLLWFYAQTGNAATAVPYVRMATDAGLAFPGMWFAGMYASGANAEQVTLLLDIERLLADGASSADLVGHWPALWSTGYADAALRLFEEAAEPMPGGRRAEWDQLISEGRGIVSELESAAGTVSTQRDATMESIRLAGVSIEAEATRVQGLVEETTSLVHGVTASELAKAYTDRADTTQTAARRWTAAAILFGLGAVAWAAVIAHDAYQKAQTGPEITAKAVLSLSVLVLAGYLGRIAGSSRRMAWHWAHVALQIRTAEPFIGNLERTTRERLLAALAVRLFPGQSLDPQSASGTHESLDVGLLLAAVLGETAHPTMPSVGEEQPSTS